MIDSGRRIRRGALIGGLLLVVAVLLGVIVWMRLPALLEREFAQRLAAAGYPGSSLQVESVGLRQLKVKDGSVSKHPWRVQLQKGTARYHPFEIFQPELRSVHLDGLRIEVDLASGGAPAAILSSDSGPWHLLAQEASGRLPLRQLSIVNGLLHLSRGQQDLTLPFEMDLTNDAANHQLSGVLSGANPQGKVRIEGGIDRESGLRIAAQLGLADDWDPWLRLVLPEGLAAAPEGLQTGPAQVALKLLSGPGEAEWRAFLGLDLAAASYGGLTIRQSAIEADATFAFPSEATNSATTSRFTGRAASIEFGGIQLADARASGECTDENARIQGVASLDDKPFAIDLRLAINAGRAGSPGFAGDFSVSDLRFRQLQLPFEWTGDQSVRITGGLDGVARFHVVPGQSPDLQPRIEFSLERVEWLEQTLTIEGIRGTLSGIVPDLPDAVCTNLVHVDLIQFRDYEAKDIIVATARLNRDAFQFELVDALILDGHVRTEPFTVGLESRKMQAVLELEQVSLAKLAELIPQFAGYIEGNLNGRLPVQFEEGRFALGAATLRLGRDRPARLRYPADGLLTKGVAADTERYQQLKLIEDALEDLRLTELLVEFLSPDHPQSPIRVRLEGTFSSAKAIIPVKFNLNVNGSVDEVLRLMRIGKIELSL